MVGPIRNINDNTPDLDQRGVLSIYVSVTIVAILSLIAFSFFFLMQNEQTQARQRQLYTQARYAAESAINDTRKVIYSEIHSQLTDENRAGGFLQKPFSVSSKAKSWYDCGETDEELFRQQTAGNKLDDAVDGNILYSCIRVNDTPSGLVYSSISDERSEQILVQTRRQDSSGNLIKENADKISIKWGQEVPDNTNPSSFNSAHSSFPAANQWFTTASPTTGISAPVLRVQIIPMNLNRGFNRDDLNKYQRTYFLYPVNKSAATNIRPYSANNANANNEIVESTCDGNVNIDFPCTATIVIDGLNTAATNYFYGRDWSHSGPLSNSNIACSGIGTSQWTDGGQVTGVSVGQSYCFRLVETSGPTTKISYSKITVAANGTPQIRLAQDQDSIDASATIVSGSINAATWAHSTPSSTDPTCSSATYNSAAATENSLAIAPANSGQYVCFRVRSSGGSFGYKKHQIDFSKTNISVQRSGSTLTAVDAASASKGEVAYMILVRSIYGRARLQVSATYKANNRDNDLVLVNQQISVTATSKAGEIIYRLREIMPIRPTYNRPEYAVDSAESICKVLIGNPDTGSQILDKAKTVNKTHPFDKSNPDFTTLAACQFH